MVAMAEGEGCEPLLPSFDQRSTEGFEPLWKFAENTLTSPSSIPLYEWTDPTTILRQIGSEHSNPPELGAWIDPSRETVLAASPLTLYKDIRMGFATFGVNERFLGCTWMDQRDLEKRNRLKTVCKSHSLPLTGDHHH